MVQIRRSALVRFTPEQMFDLVNDVEAYPKRFPWCVGASILEHHENVMVARLNLRLAGLRPSFTTRNTGHRPERLDMQLVDGPLRKLEGGWTFTSLGQQGCKVELNLDFDVAGGLGAAALRMGFQSLANRMVDDFCAEAEQAYA
ncbi:type II toxin-antitoxin system RatA family toxin [Oleiagrimonas sp.]|uniref:type II toxin-antitoxin system RatA family toxin n=1 Tax=Oleiagrimonas sp. TaxID=2010330 RepID=UPI00262FAD2D|nr:type II toxin-antitoxin system RatA family toxin [Oleiagrimonas sp.]MDA3914031.1 type II toxin-antitoxin system RatA family toxin [Oleiagrimonas sp.]